MVELAPFTRKLHDALGDLRGPASDGAAQPPRCRLPAACRAWKSYLEIADPRARPAVGIREPDRIDAMMREPGRMKVLQKTSRITPADADAQLANVRCPALIVQGSLDPDWADPRAEGEAIVAAMPAGLGRLEMIEGAGHYPHVQYPAEVVTMMLSFLDSVRA